MMMDGETKLLTNIQRFVGAAGIDDDTFIGHLQQRRHLHQQARRITGQ
jgi:hypothetical protein